MCRKLMLEFAKLRFKIFLTICSKCTPCARKHLSDFMLCKSQRHIFSYRQLITWGIFIIFANKRCATRHHHHHLGWLVPFSSVWFVVLFAERCLQGTWMCVSVTCKCTMNILMLWPRWNSLSQWMMMHWVLVNHCFTCVVCGYFFVWERWLFKQMSVCGSRTTSYYWLANCGGLPVMD